MKGAVCKLPNAVLVEPNVLTVADSHCLDPTRPIGLLQIAVPCPHALTEVVAFENHGVNPGCAQGFQPRLGRFEERRADTAAPLITRDR